MKKLRLNRLAITSVLAAGLSVSLASPAVHATQSALPTSEKNINEVMQQYFAQNEKQMDDIIHRYLVQHPEVLLEMSTALKAKQDQISAQSVSEVIKAHADDIYHDSSDPSIGPAKASKTLVEFLDYNCGYCRHAWPMVKSLLASSNDVRVVFKEYPILSDGSVLAAQASLIVNKIHPDRFIGFHDAMMNYDGKIDSEQVVAELAGAAGLDWDEIKQHMKDQDIDAQLRKIHGLGRDMNVTGTPAFFVGDQLMGGSPRAPEDLQQLIDQAKPL